MDRGRYVMMRGKVFTCGVLLAFSMCLPAGASALRCNLIAGDVAFQYVHFTQIVGDRLDITREMRESIGSGPLGDLYPTAQEQDRLIARFTRDWVERRTENDVWSAVLRECMDAD